MLGVKSSAIFLILLKKEGVGTAYVHFLDISLLLVGEGNMV